VASGSFRRLSIILTTRSSGTSPPAFMIGLGLVAERRVVSDLIAQHVPGCDVRDTEADRDARCLGPLAAPRRSEHQGDHLAIT